MLVRHAVVRLLGRSQHRHAAANRRHGAGRVEPTAPSKFKIVFLGDSLTAGFGLLSEQAFPELIQQRFAAEGYSLVEIVNAGMSGDTTAGGLRRVDDALEPDARIMVVALGGNDALRGLTTASDARQPGGASSTPRRPGAWASCSPGWRRRPTSARITRPRSTSVFIQLAQTYSRQIAFVPFLLEGVAGNPSLNQADGIHPNEKGAIVIADQVYPRLRTLVDQMGGGG